MTQEQQIIQQIQQRLASAQIERNDSLEDLLFSVTQTHGIHLLLALIKGEC